MATYRTKVLFTVIFYSQFIFAVTSISTVNKDAETKITAKDVNYNAMETTIRKLLELFRKGMPNGIHLLGIPPLEPYEKDHLKFDLKHQIGTINGYMNQLYIANLSTFETVDVKYSYKSRLLVLNLTIPQILIKGEYNFDGFAARVISIFGEGDCRMNFFNLDVNIDSLLKCRLTCRLEDLHINVKMDQSKCQFDKIMGGGELEEVFNRLLTDMMPEFLDLLWPDLEPKISRIMMKVFNNALGISNSYRHWKNKIT